MKIIRADHNSNIEEINKYNINHNLKQSQQEMHINSSRIDFQPTKGSISMYNTDNMHNHEHVNFTRQNFSPEIDKVCFQHKEQKNLDTKNLI